MAFPFSKLPGYPDEAKTTETAKPGLVPIATESSRRSTQAYRRIKGKHLAVIRRRWYSSLYQNDCCQIGLLAEE